MDTRIAAHDAVNSRCRLAPSPTLYNPRNFTLQPPTDPPTHPQDFGSDEQISELAGWLVRNQPISLAMNTVGGDFGYARKLFEQTGQVVYTVGSEGNPALTCQARPQEGEIFGEFPVRIYRARSGTRSDTVKHYYC